MLVASMALVACKKDEAVLPTATSEATKATLTGTAYAELNWNTEGAEKAPDGTVVVATWVTMKQVYNPQVGYEMVVDQTFTYSGTVTGGKYSISIPVGEKTKTYTVSYGDFTADQTQLTGQLPATVSKHYTVANKTVTLNGGMSKELNVTYTGTTGSSNGGVTTGKATLTGIAKCNLNEINDTPTMTYDNVPDGTKVVFTVTSGADDEKRYETTVISGAFKFEINVPAGENTVDGDLSFDEFSTTVTQSAVAPTTRTEIMTNGGASFTLTAGFTKIGGNVNDGTGVMIYLFN